MSRRRTHEADFGSDAFLDVLANMVGILIILIVIAGVRAARGPDLSPAPAASIVTTEPAESVALAAAPEVVRVAPEPESDDPPAELRREMQKLEAEFLALQAEQSQSDALLKKVRHSYASVRKESTAAAAALAERKAALDEQKARVARLQQSLGERKQALAALLAEFEEAKNSRAPVTQVKHRLAPISQEVQGEEMHFRLSGNRVSFIPWMLLAERMNTQIERQKDWLSQHPGHLGVVGPIDGYSMQYKIERLPLSPVETRRLGFGGYRLGTTYLEIIPDPDLVAETADQALRRGSRFAAALQTAPEHASLTFWVYPDSFGMYRVLQEAMHAEGFVVAARPMPEGIPIAASRNGSRSAGQ